MSSLTREYEGCYANCLTVQSLIFTNMLDVPFQEGKAENQNWKDVVKRLKPCNQSFLAWLTPTMVQWEKESIDHEKAREERSLERVWIEKYVGKWHNYL